MQSVRNTETATQSFTWIWSVQLLSATDRLRITMEFVSFRWVPVIYLVELIGISCVFQFTKQGNLQSTMLSIFSRRNLIINGQGKREELELNDLTDSCLWQWNKVVPVQATKAYGGQDVQLHLLSLALEGCQLHAQAALPQRMSPLPIEYEAGWIS